MRLVFAGTPQFAASALTALISVGHEVLLVLTQPDRPSGRGLKEKQSAVKVVALEHGLPLFQPLSLKDPEACARVIAAAPEVIVVVAYGLILPQPVLDIAPQGALNIHASLLPRWRGAAPVQRAILAGDRETGVCIMQMDAGLDTGPVLRHRNIVISADDTSGSLLEKLTEVGAQLIVDSLDELRATSLGGAVTLIAQPQPAAGVTYAAKIEKRESRINWNEPAILIERKVRAFSPSPGTVTRLNGVEFKIWQARLCDGTGLPGEVLAFEDGVLRVACGQGALQLLELQRAGGRRLHAREFSLGIPVRAGNRCELPTIVS